MVFERPSSDSMERQWFSMGAYHWPNDPIVKPIVLVVKKEPITIGANCQCKGISYLRDIHWTRWNGNGFQQYTTIGKTIFWYRTGSPPNHCSGLLDNVQPAYDEQHVQLKKPDQATMSDQHEKLDTL